jgi:hypothetical protein
MNIVYRYLMDSELKDTEPFSQIPAQVAAVELTIDDEFFEKLGLQKDATLASIKQFMIKKEYFRAMLQHVKDSVTPESMADLISEYYLVNKAKYVAPESRDLSVISVADKEQAKALQSQLKGQDLAQFHAMAKTHSTDPSVELNEGNWGEFRESDFRYHFVNHVFNAPVGVMDEVYFHNGEYLVVRVNAINEAQPMSYEQAKDQIFRELKDNTIKRKIQSIINTQARFEIEINPESTAHVFERYKVFIEE